MKVTVNPPKTKKLKQNDVKERMIVTVLRGKDNMKGKPYVITAISLPFVNIRSLRNTETFEIIDMSKDDLGRTNLKFAKTTAYNQYSSLGKKYEAWESAWKELTERDKKGRFVKPLF